MLKALKLMKYALWNLFITPFAAARCLYTGENICDFLMLLRDSPYIETLSEINDTNEMIVAVNENPRLWALAITVMWYISFPVVLLLIPLVAVLELLDASRGLHSMIITPIVFVLINELKMAVVVFKELGDFITSKFAGLFGSKASDNSSDMQNNISMHNDPNEAANMVHTTGQPITTAYDNTSEPLDVPVDSNEVLQVSSVSPTTRRHVPRSTI